MGQSETHTEAQAGASRASEFVQWADRLRASNPELLGILTQQTSLTAAREATYDYLERAERATYRPEDRRHPLERAAVRACARKARGIVARGNEDRIGVSALDCLWKIARGRYSELRWPVRRAFVEDVAHLLQGIDGRAHLYGNVPRMEDDVPEFVRLEGRPAALARSESLDGLGGSLSDALHRYPSGLDPAIAARREHNRKRVASILGASSDDWQDYHWHLEHVVTDPEELFELIQVPRGYRKALRQAAAIRLPFGITPYYVSLMDEESSRGSFDAAIRAQVLPPPSYVEAMAGADDARSEAFDFMGEQDTSPVDLITRRYPRICILKPYNTCSQICVYCQRNWEIDECMAGDAMAPDDDLDAAIEWIEEHPAIGDVLVTGGDPVVMEDDRIERVLERLAAVEHVYRIRLGTRTPVVLPFRWTADLADLIGRYHESGRREVAVMTHFEHPSEVTPEAREAVQRIRRRGVGVYNQQVFTTFNSRRYETVKLRMDLRVIGVDPYYSFNAKGKRETRDYRVPIARILQERKEEARLLPGLDRTDEPVFNVPRLGKAHLRSPQDRVLSMIKPDGSRVYEFHPWEKNLEAVPPYLYTDVPLQDYLDRLEAMGEDPREYSTLWYYY